jgi:hypothetical protein
MNDPKKIHVKDGWVPLKKGYTPKKVQGGYVPTTATTADEPPRGGSGARPPKK